MVKLTKEAKLEQSGYSKSLWKSLVVKAQRMGWPAAIEAANEVLDSSTMESLLICGLFEDTFPAGEVDFKSALQQIRKRDYRGLCARETHHGRGLSDAFCDLEPLAKAHAADPSLNDDARRIGFWMPRRAGNCFYTWLTLNPRDIGVRRTIDETPFTAIPVVMADGHTLEGRQRRTLVTLLSGHYHNHRALGHRVMAEGWDSIRREVHGGGSVTTSAHQGPRIHKLF